MGARKLTPDNLAKHRAGTQRDTKQCDRCERVLPITDFAKDGRSKGKRLAPTCKTCQMQRKNPSKNKPGKMLTKSSINLSSSIKQQREWLAKHYPDWLVIVAPALDTIDFIDEQIANGNEDNASVRTRLSAAKDISSMVAKLYSEHMAKKETGKDDDLVSLLKSKYE